MIGVGCVVVEHVTTHKHGEEERRGGERGDGGEGGGLLGAGVVGG